MSERPEINHKRSWSSFLTDVYILAQNGEDNTYIELYLENAIGRKLIPDEKTDMEEMAELGRN